MALVNSYLSPVVRPSPLRCSTPLKWPVNLFPLIVVCTVPEMNPVNSTNSPAPPAPHGMKSTKSNGSEALISLVTVAAASAGVSGPVGSVGHHVIRAGDDQH